LVLTFILHSNLALSKKKIFLNIKLFVKHDKESERDISTSSSLAIVRYTATVTIGNIYWQSVLQLGSWCIESSPLDVIYKFFWY
jgi:hypothetical protein